MAKVDLAVPRQRSFGFKVGNKQYVYRGEPIEVDANHAKLLCDPDYAKGNTASGLGLEWVTLTPQSTSKPKAVKPKTETDK